MTVSPPIIIKGPSREGGLPVNPPWIVFSSLSSRTNPLDAGLSALDRVTPLSALDYHRLT